MASIAERWDELNAEMDELCRELGRDPPRIIAVSKTRTEEEIQEAIDQGINDFGENHPIEFKRKAEAFPGQNWHFIGHLQRNNAQDVTPYANMIHSLDRKKLTRRLDYFGFRNPCFVQVNITGERSKSGVEYTKEKVEELVNYSVQEGLDVIGLMTIGSYDWPSERTLKEFTTFVEFGRDLGLDEFSLGMTDDWREAVTAGSTCLRIGSAIFGPRQ